MTSCDPTVTLTCTYFKHNTLLDCSPAVGEEFWESLFALLLIARSLSAIIRKHISNLWPDLDLTCDLLKKILMRIGIFSFRTFDRRLARLAAPISSGVRQGEGAEYSPPPSLARSAEYPSGARVNASFGKVCMPMSNQMGWPHFLAKSRNRRIALG